MRHLGDYISGATIDFKFSTVSQAFAPITLAGSPAVAVYKGNSTTETTAGVTLTVNFDGRTGLHNVRIVLTDPFYGTGENYDVVLTSGTVDGVSVAGRRLASFTIQKAAGVARVLRALPDAVVNGNGGLHAAVWRNEPCSQLTPTTAELTAAPTLEEDDVRGRAVVLYSDNGSDTAVRTAVAYDPSTLVLTFTPPVRAGFNADTVLLLNNPGVRADANAFVQADVVRFGGAAGAFAAGRPEVNTTHWDGSSVGSASVRANLVQVAGNTASSSGAVTFPAGTLASTTNITGGTITNLANLPAMPNDWITAAGIAGGALTSAKFGSGAITSTVLADGAITEPKVATGAFTAAKFAAGAFDAVWTVSTRTLTSFGTLIADIWAYLTSSATVAGSIGKRIADFLDAPVSSLTSGSGAYVVTVTVTDGSSPLHNATVRLTEGVNSFVATTNASGIATFALDAATYTLSLTKPGYSAPVTTVAINSATNVPATMTANTLPPPASPNGCTVVAVTRTHQLTIEPNVAVGFRYVSLPPGSGTLLPRNALVVVSDNNGQVAAELLRGARVKYWRGREPAAATDDNTFTVPDATSFTLPDLLGEDAT